LFFIRAFICEFRGEYFCFYFFVFTPDFVLFFIRSFICEFMPSRWSGMAAKMDCTRRLRDEQHRGQNVLSCFTAGRALLWDLAFGTPAERQDARHERRSRGITPYANSAPKCLYNFYSFASISPVRIGMPFARASFSVAALSCVLKTTMALPSVFSTKAYIYSTLTLCSAKNPSTVSSPPG